MLLGKHMHGTSLATADAGLLPKQFRHDLPCGHVLAQCVDVVAVCGADVVVTSQQANDTGAHCLLPGVKVHEAKHLACTLAHLSDTQP